MQEEIFELAERTSRHIFLTGKAGTGKTTFLNDFVRRTRKKHIILAPTGIAAINAGGVTIHSMFGLPLRSFLPTNERINEESGNNIPALYQHFRFRKDKLKLLREVEIIIIDEVSMLRADVLDMVDHALRFIRRNGLPFGGVQMLFVGDLFQLPPVVREEHILREYYESPYFFSAKALEGTDFVTAELTKVYRQTDDEFLQVLNQIRNANPNDSALQTLNARLDANFNSAEKGFVYLTSHNAQANKINEKKMAELPGREFEFGAKISGEFNEKAYPIEPNLKLKVGAQVMFVRNDISGEKKYYNGRLAEVIALTEEEAQVRIAEEDEPYTLKKVSWENKRYSLKPDKTIAEEVLGSFEQYPIRLAWAVTIHKSQGLTFDRVVIDAGQSFTSGQVYVALSRCRTLEGITLLSPISRSNIFSDHRILDFHKSTVANERITEIVQNEKYSYAIYRFLQKINPKWMVDALIDFYSQAAGAKKLDKQTLAGDYQSILTVAKNSAEVFTKYETVLDKKVRKVRSGEDFQSLIQQAKGAVEHFYNLVNDQIFGPLKSLHALIKGVAGLKSVNESLKTLLEDVQDYLKDLQSVTLLETPLFQGEKKEITAAVVKVPSQIISWQMLQSGKTLNQVAKERGLAETTIIGHIAKYAENGTLTMNDLHRVIAEEKVAEFQKLAPKIKAETISEWKNALPNEFDFGEIRLLLVYFGLSKKD